MNEWKHVHQAAFKYSENHDKEGEFKLAYLVVKAISDFLLYGVDADFPEEKTRDIVFKIFKEQGGFKNKWEIQLFGRMSFLLFEDFKNFETLLTYAFDFLNNNFEEDSLERAAIIAGIATNSLQALHIMKCLYSNEYPSDRDLMFKKLHALVIEQGKKTLITGHIEFVNRLFEEYNRNLITNEKETISFLNSLMNSVFNN